MVYSSEWYRQNKEKIDARNKQWREANKEKVREQQMNWRRANEGHTYEDSTGYVKYIGFEHPAATPSGITTYGRIVLWDKLGGRDTNCHWCDKPLSWSKSYPEEGALVADHVNTVKNDNRPENVVAACNHCNVTRPGGQARKPSPNANRPCEAVEGCDRKATTHAKSNPNLWVCMPHYMQDYQGKEFKPLRTYYARGGMTDTEKECMVCDTWKPHSEFYWRNGKPKGACKKCEIKRVQDAAKRRLANAEQCAECDKPVLAKGLCGTHYSRKWYAEKRAVNKKEMEEIGHDYELEEEQ